MWWCVSADAMRMLTKERAIQAKINTPVQWSGSGASLCHFGTGHLRGVPGVNGWFFRQGSAVGDKSNWRKMALKSEFSTAERNLLDSRWDFEHPGASLICGLWFVTCALLRACFVTRCDSARALSSLGLCSNRSSHIHMAKSLFSLLARSFNVCVCG